MGNTNSSIGRGPAFGGNENHDGDPLRKTLGETVEQEAPAGNDVMDEKAPAEGTPQDQTKTEPPRK